MRRPFTGTLQAAIACWLLILCSGCFRDDCKHAYKIRIPVYKTLSEVRALIKSEGPRPLNNTGKLYIIGDRIYLNEQDKGIHVIDNSDPRHPVNTAFINIPGNRDLVVKDNILYADQYCDLMAADISKAGSMAIKKTITNMFPYRAANYLLSNNPDSIKVITDWIEKDTIVDCEAAQRVSTATPQFVADASKAATGTGGSMARFTTVSNYLYTVSDRALNVVDISNGANPSLVKTTLIGTGIETIYPFKDNVFIGSMSAMLVYNVQDPAAPVRTSWAGHWPICDPVIADDGYAYVTLHDGLTCSLWSSSKPLNQLEVYDISTIAKPTLVKTYPLTSPHGLSKDGDLLFICDGRDGLKVYDASNAKELKLLQHIAGMETYDVITINGIAYVVTKNGLHQYAYDSAGKIRLLSKLGWFGVGKSK